MFGNFEVIPFSLDNSDHRLFGDLFLLFYKLFSTNHDIDDSDFIYPEDQDLLSYPKSIKLAMSCNRNLVLVGLCDNDDLITVSQKNHVYQFFNQLDQTQLVDKLLFDEAEHCLAQILARIELFLCDYHQLVIVFDMNKQDSLTYHFLVRTASMNSDMEQEHVIRFHNEMADICMPIPNGRDSILNHDDYPLAAYYVGSVVLFKHDVGIDSEVVFNQFQSLVQFDVTQLSDTLWQDLIKINQILNGYHDIYGAPEGAFTLLDCEPYNLFKLLDMKHQQCIDTPVWHLIKDKSIDAEFRFNLFAQWLNNMRYQSILSNDRVGKLCLERYYDSDNNRLINYLFNNAGVASTSFFVQPKFSFNNQEWLFQDFDVKLNEYHKVIWNNVNAWEIIGQSYYNDCYCDIEKKWFKDIPVFVFTIEVKLHLKALVEVYEVLIKLFPKLPIREAIRLLMEQLPYIHQRYEQHHISRNLFIFQDYNQPLNAVHFLFESNDPYGGDTHHIPNLASKNNCYLPMDSIMKQNVDSVIYNINNNYDHQKWNDFIAVPIFWDCNQLSAERNQNSDCIGDLESQVMKTKRKPLIRILYWLVKLIVQRDGLQIELRQEMIVLRKFVKWILRNQQLNGRKKKSISPQDDIYHFWKPIVDDLNKKYNKIQ